MKIITHFVYPPIPDRRWDWSAVTDDYEPGAPMGEGATEAEAIADLKAQLADREEERSQARAVPDQESDAP